MSGSINDTLDWRIFTDEENIHIWAGLSDHLMVRASFDSKMIQVSLIQDRHIPDLLERYTPDTEEEFLVAMEAWSVLPEEYSMRNCRAMMKRFISDPRWTTVLTGAAEWFEVSMVRGDTLRLGMRKEVDVHISANLLEMMLDDGYRHFLDDESVPRMKRATMFISALNSATDCFWANGERNFDIEYGNYLSASMARTIADNVDFAALATMEAKELTTGGFGRGFNLFAPVGHGSSQITMDSLWFMYHCGFDDHMYKFTSVVLARMADQQVSAENGWTITDLGDCFEDEGNNLTIDNWVNCFRGCVRVDDVLLERISVLTQAQARRFYRVVFWVFSEERLLPFIHTSGESPVRLSAMAIDLVLRLVEVGFGEDSMSVITSVIYRPALPDEALSPQATRWSDLITTVTERADQPIRQRALWVVTLYSLTKQCGQGDRFAEVANFWGDELFEGNDFVTRHDLAARYLSLPDDDESADLPFSWWMRLNAVEGS